MCAYINKNDAVKRCTAELDSSIQKAKNALNICKNTDVPISAFTGFSKIKKNLIKLQKTCETLIVLDAETGKIYRTAIDAIEPRVSFGIHIENDADESIATILKEVLESEGFVCGGNAALHISGAISISQSENDAGVFAQPNLSLKILNQQGEILYSYSRRYKKGGHRNFDSAVRKAYAEIDKDLRANFMNIFQ